MSVCVFVYMCHYECVSLGSPIIYAVKEKQRRPSLLSVRALAGLLLTFGFPAASGARGGGLSVSPGERFGLSVTSSRRR